MIRVQHIPSLDLVFIRAQEPFSFLDMSAQADTARAAPDLPEHDLTKPILFDFRAVSLIRQDSADIQKMFARRAQLEPASPNNLAAHIVANEDDYGMMRMCCSNAAIWGLRDLENSHVTLDPAEAVQWLLARMGKPEASQNALMQALEDQGVC